MTQAERLQAQLDALDKDEHGGYKNPVDALELTKQIDAAMQIEAIQAARSTEQIRDELASAKEDRVLPTAAGEGDVPVAADTARRTALGEFLKTSTYKSGIEGLEVGYKGVDITNALGIRKSNEILKDGTGTGDFDIFPTQSRELLDAARGRLRMKDVLPIVRSATGQYQEYVESNYTDSADDTIRQDEADVGNAIAEITAGAVQATRTIRSRLVYVFVARDAMDDEPLVMSEVESRMEYDLNQAIETVVNTQLAALAGSQTSAVASSQDLQKRLNALGAGQARQETIGREVDAIFMHPNDFHTAWANDLMFTRVDNRPNRVFGATPAEYIDIPIVRSSKVTEKSVYLIERRLLPIYTAADITFRLQDASVVGAANTPNSVAPPADGLFVIAKVRMEPILRTTNGGYKLTAWRA